MKRGELLKNAAMALDRRMHLLFSLQSFPDYYDDDNFLGDRDKISKRVDQLQFRTFLNMPRFMFLFLLLYKCLLNNLST